MSFAFDCNTVAYVQRLKIVERWGFFLFGEGFFLVEGVRKEENKTTQVQSAKS